MNRYDDVGLDVFARQQTMALLRQAAQSRDVDGAVEQLSQKLAEKTAECERWIKRVRLLEERIESVRKLIG